MQCSSRSLRNLTCSTASLYRWLEADSVRVFLPESDIQRASLAFLGRSILAFCCQRAAPKPRRVSILACSFQRAWLTALSPANCELISVSVLPSRECDGRQAELSQTRRAKRPNNKQTPTERTDKASQYSFPNANAVGLGIVCGNISALPAGSCRTTSSC